MTGKEELRKFLTGEMRHIGTEAAQLMTDSVETARDARDAVPANIAVDTRLLKQLLQGYRWAVQRGYIGD